MKFFFISGQDTDIGKTRVASALLRFYAKEGKRVAGYKPLASGCIETPLGLRSQDALDLMAAGNCILPYDEVNPYAFLPPIAPEYAAQMQGVSLSAKGLYEKSQLFLNQSLDLGLIEGCGGWYVPLNEKETLADYVILLNIPIILVVGLKLGCLNHAILTAKAMIQDGVFCIGWIGNDCQNSPEKDKLMNTLKNYLPMPCIGFLPFGEESFSRKNLTNCLISV